jgi:hypothetical protein
LPCRAQGHQHEGDVIIGFRLGVNDANQLALELEADHATELPPVDGILAGWAGEDPGFESLEEDEPDEGFYALIPGAEIVLDVIGCTSGFKAHTPGFADRLDSPGDQLILGGPPFHVHLEWHIDSSDPGFDPERHAFSFTAKLLDTGTTAYGPSEPFTLHFTNLSCSEVSCEISPQLPGDCNQDADIDISDALCLLQSLFGGARPLPCSGSGDLGPGVLTLLDWNMDAAIDISDGISVFNWLFVGGPPHGLGSACQPIPGCPAACAAEEEEG